MTFVKSKYNSKTVVMPTKHDKAKLIAPHFYEVLSMEIKEVAFDTDLLGTFSGEIERVGTPLETAFEKARLGIEATGNPYVVASEGSVAVDPLFPFINANFEILVFIDIELDIQIYETLKSNKIVAATTTTIKDNLEVFLKQADFPNHALIVKPHKGSGAIKGIRDMESLTKALADARNQSSDGEAIIESDLRAMSSPSRQRNIAELGLKLAKRIASICPECQTPGWGLKDFLRGVNCSECGEYAESALKQEVLGCVKCEYTAEGVVINSTLDPSRCMSCNP